MMKRSRSILFYCLTLVGLSLLIYFVLNSGKAIEHAPAGIIKTSAAKDSIVQAFSHPLAVFILQLVIIIAVSRVCAYLFKKIGQPAVMGEIIAGILLGPSLFGTLIPGFTNFVFPASSLNNLQMLSQVGLILFMFVIGMELDINVIKKKAGPAFIISYASIIFPFGLGMLLSYYLYSYYAPAGVPFYAFSLFVGISMSITAFPVLARIIQERKMTNTKTGIIALTAAAAGDITVWCVLAFVIAIAKAGNSTNAIYTTIFALVYLGVMLGILKPLLKKLVASRVKNELIERSTLAIIFIVLLLSAYFCELIGIHALFGAFMAGIIMPQEWNFRQVLIDKIEDVALVLLLPLFFVFTGLRTQVGLLNNSSLWVCCLLIIIVAVAGKLGGSALAAKFTGENTKDSFAIGALMNTRGLVELVVLNVGYDMGILSPEMFTMLVIMALITTFMTNPLLNRIYNTKKGLS
ncbi:MAG: cation:proton antiporter [Bacteroidetes bacterium]|nr:cation:proton antiporter [Bacteroidota bacterium]